MAFASPVNPGRRLRSLDWMGVFRDESYLKGWGVGMKIVIPGGSGQVGSILARAFSRHGHEVVVLSRRPRPAPWRVVPWDAETLGAWAVRLADRDAPARSPAAGAQISGRTRSGSRRLRGDSGADRPPSFAAGEPGAAVDRASPTRWNQTLVEPCYAGVT